MRIRKYGIFYLVAGIFALGLKCFYRQADSDELLWLLSPTSWWVKSLSGYSFVYESGVGYISHALRFIIAPSCAGVQFLIICMVTLICSFVHHMGTWRKGFVWTLFSIVVSYLFTILVNGIRIVTAIWLPQILEGTIVYNGWLTPDRLHTMIGTVIYFTALYVIYWLAEAFSKRIAGTTKVDMIYGYIQPLFWYFLIVLGVPFLNRMFRNDYEGFFEYVQLIVSICIAIFLLTGLIGRLALTLTHFQATIRENRTYQQSKGEK